MSNRPSNRKLRDLVQDQLDWEAGLDAEHIGVSVAGDVVTLTGHVSSYAQRRMAEKSVKRVAGVRGLANDLEVRIPRAHERSDSDIAETAVSRLKDTVQLTGQDIRVTVKNGHLTLDGTVDWEYQRRRAAAAVRYIRGVRDVTNLLTLTSRSTPSDLRERIKKALERQVDREADRIQITVDGSTVTLTGHVRSWADREDIERAVWSGAGVTKIKNQLVIGEEVAA